MQSERSFSFWNRFWFQPTSPAPVCVLRVLYGALVLSCCLLWAPDLLTYFGPDGLVSLQTIQHYEGSQRFSLLFLLPQTDASVFFVFLLLVCSAVTVSVGLYTRISLITLFLCLVSLHHRNVAILNSGDTLLRIIGFLLIFSPCGQMFSIDRKQSRDLTDHWKLRTACWTQRLLQLQVWPCTVRLLRQKLIRMSGGMEQRSTIPRDWKTLPDFRYRLSLIISGPASS